MICFNLFYIVLVIIGVLLCKFIIDEVMKDLGLVGLVYCLGWQEGFFVVSDLGIIDFKEFLCEVEEECFLNLFFGDILSCIVIDILQKILI